LPLVKMILSTGVLSSDTMPHALTSEPAAICDFDFVGLVHWKECHDETQAPEVRLACKMRVRLAGEPPQLAEDVDGAVQMFPVSPQMNKPSYNEPNCIAPLSKVSAIKPE
jgi:hypothetical protein